MVKWSIIAKCAHKSTCKYKKVYKKFNKIIIRFGRKCNKINWSIEWSVQYGIKYQRVNMAAFTEGQIMQKVCLAIILCNVALKAKLVNARRDLNNFENSRQFLIDLESGKESALQELEDNKFKRQTTGSEGMATFDTGMA